MNKDTLLRQTPTTGEDVEMDRTIDVLIVGAGPVGLTMACELLRHGVSCHIIDQLATPAQTSRALNIQGRTLEVFDTMGIAERVRAAGRELLSPTVYDGDRMILRISYHHLRASRYPAALILPQDQTERFLRAHLSELGGTVERSRELLDIRQEDDAVIARVKASGTDAGGEEEIRARWLIGCDGAHSTVRKVQAIPFEGKTTPEEFLLADVDLLGWNKSRESTHAWLTSDGLFAVFPLPSGQWRLFAMSRDEEDQEVAQASVEVFQRLLVQYTGDTRTRISNPTWMSNFRISYRVASEFRKGRVFLAGDAAHIHSPVGGQGMNTGIQDAYNLAWKLALVLQRKGQESLLDTYQQERMPIARSALRGSQTATGILTSPNPVSRWLRDHIVLFLFNRAFVQRPLAQQASGLKLNYRHSELSRSFYKDRMNMSRWLSWWRAPHAGDRARPGECFSYPSNVQTDLFQVFHGPQSHLLLFAGKAPVDKEYWHLVELAAKVETLTSGCVKAHLVLAESKKPEQLPWNGSILLDPQGKLHALYGARRPSLYFIRPDGYIGFRSQPVSEEQLLAYLGRIFTIVDSAIFSLASV
jgi:2-polyprenyl-6-methoxyphenol hydroxylase-like FAD-dependent oxidoreductase